MGWKPRKAALRLDVSQSQLIRLARAHPPALAMWNEQRRAKGMHALK